MKRETTLDPEIVPDAVPESIGFDFAALTPRERYKILIGTVVPRPIALVTTVDADGRPNAAPFSFFNCLSADPAILALGVEFRADGTSKDTGANIRATGGFTVHIVSNAIMDAMNVCAVPFAPSVDELAEAGLATAPGTTVPSPRILAAPAALECRLHSFLDIGTSREIILGEVTHVHLHRAAIDPEKLYVDHAVIDAVGRMGGHGYARTRDYFELPTMSVKDYRARRQAVAAGTAHSKSRSALGE